MTLKNNNQSYGIPAPITELTMEQDLKMRPISDALDNPDADRKDIKTVFMALQKQNFVLTNSLTNLLAKWPKPPMKLDQPITGVDPSKSGILFVIKT